MTCVDAKTEERKTSLVALFVIFLVLSSAAVVGINSWGSGSGCKKPPPLTALVSLSTAIINFETECGNPPHSGGKLKTDSPEGVAMLKALLGTEGPAAIKKNPKDIKFLVPGESGRGRAGLKYDKSSKELVGLVDEWGNPYTVEFNPAGSSNLRFRWGNETVTLPNRGHAVGSPGKDGKAGNIDDVVDWR